MVLGFGLQINKLKGIINLVFKLISALRGRSTYYENSSATKTMLNNLYNCKTSTAFGLLNTLESRSTYFENRINTRAQLVKLENCTT
jgi:hypothetical protein